MQSRGLGVCSRTTRLKNNQVRSRKRAIKTEKGDDWGAAAVVKTVPQLGCVSQDSEPSELPKSVKYRGNPRRKVLGSIRRVRFTQSTLRQASLREKEGPSIEKIHVKIPHQRSPYAMKCEDRSQEETERQQRCARGKAWNLAKNIFKLKEKDKAAFYFPTEEWVLPVTSKKSPRKESLPSIPEQVYIWSARETLTLPNWRP